MLELMNQAILEVNARRRVEVLEETMRASRSRPEPDTAPPAAEHGHAQFVSGVGTVTARRAVCSEA